MKKTFLALIFLFAQLLTYSQIPEGYYDAAIGKQHEALKNELHRIINNNNTLDYSVLWNYFILTDSKENDKVWDIYSDIPNSPPPYEYTFVSNQCGNYSGEGDCYNREHSIPNSWFGGKQYPMYSDLFHLYPTDGWVNNKRGNYPYGEVENTTWTSLNSSKLGSCSYPGYSGIVFEPIDEYKGDLARTYFYMSVRYMDKNLGQTNTSVFSGAELAPWALSMLIEWHLADTVSPKEIARNNTIYTIQQNRNPFIDYPELASYLWSTDTTNVFAPYTVTGIPLHSPRVKQIFPNPAREQITITLSDNVTGDILISDMAGKTVLSQAINSKNQIQINILALTPGLYTVMLIDKYQKEIQKLIIW